MSTNYNTNTKPVSGATYRQSQQQGHIWEAPSGNAILVRDIDIADYAVLNQFPDDLRKLAFAAIERSAVLSIKGDENADVDPFAGLSGEELLRSQAELAITLCKLGWVSPRVVDKPEHELEEDEIRPEHILSGDRMAYATYVYSGVTGESAKLSQFRHQQSAGVGARSSSDSVQPAAFGHARDEGSWVSERDSV